MENQLKKQISQALQDYLQLHNLSQGKFAQHSKINISYISSLCNNKTTVGETEIADKWYYMIADKIGFAIGKRYWKIVETPQMMRILTELEEAKEFSRMGVIIGETGCGKTYISDLFAQACPTEVFKITVSQQDTIGDLIDKVVDVLGIQSGRTRSKRMNDIISHLRSVRYQGFKPMLIFDESEYMKQPSLCSMKEFCDNLAGVASIVMIGTDQLTRNIEKLRKQNKDGIPQLWRRIKFGVRTLPKIDRRFTLFLKEIEDKNLVKFLCANCDNYGELHDVLVPCMKEAERLDCELSENLVKTVLGISA